MTGSLIFLQTFRHEIFYYCVLILRDSRLERAELINHHPPELCVARHKFLYYIEGTGYYMLVGADRQFGDII